MKQNPLNLSQLRVNFKYTSSPTRRESIHQFPSKTGPYPPHHTVSGKEINVHKLTKCEFPSSKASQFVINHDQTLKKESLSVEVVTLRKTNKKIDEGQVSGEVNQSNNGSHSSSTISKSNQINALKQEIRFMRKRLNEAENAQKQLRLQFQIYKANAQTVSKELPLSKQEVLQTKSGLSGQDGSLLQQLAQKQRLIEQCKKQNISLHNRIFEQTRRSAILQKQLQQKNDQNKQLVMQTSLMYNQIQMRCNDLNNLSHQFNGACESNKQFFNQNASLKDILSQKDNILIQNQKFLVQLKQKCSIFQEKVRSHEVEIERMASVINQLKLHSQSTIKVFENESVVLQDYQKRMNSFNEVREGLQKELVLRGNEHNSIRQMLQTQNNRLKSDMLLLQSNLNTLLGNQRIMLSQIQWLRAQLSLQVGKYQLDLQEMQAKHQSELFQIEKAHFQVLNKKQEEIQILQQEINKMNGSKTKIESETSFSKIQAHPLSTQELHKHLQLLKGQPEQISSQDFEKVSEQNQTLKQQLQMLRMAKDHEIKHVRQMYQTQMRVNNQQYTHQLSIYMKEVEILMEEMEKLKEKKEYCSDVIQEEPEQLEYDDQKIKNDLKMYGDDSSDIYMTPPSNTPVKCDPTEQQQANQINEQFVLNQIIDLDCKINNYIVNFNKMRKTESRENHESDL